MALRYWKRMREQAALHADDARPAATNRWQDRPAPTLSQLGAAYVGTDDRAALYRDWAARMRDPQRPPVTPVAEPAPSTAGYWSAEALFEDSRRIEREDLPTKANPWQVRELLALLDLRDGATTADIGRAYRRLVNEHHPDRFVSADPDTEAFHAARMRTIIDAYQTLRQLENA